MRTALNGPALSRVSRPALLSAWTKSWSSSSLQRGQKTSALFGGKSGIFVGAAKMSEDARELHMRRGYDLLIELVCLFMPDAEPSHAGVDFKMHGERASARAPHII
jgi:hypothetical protein